MYEPCNVLQSGPRFDFIQPFVTHFWNLCSASAIQLLSEPRQLLCHPVHSHLLYVKTISTKHITLVSHVSFPACFTSDMFQSSQVNFSHGTNRQTFPMTSSAMLKFNSNTFKRKLQISSPRFPLLLFTLSHTPTQNYTTALFLSQDTLQSSTAANLVNLHASLLVVQDVQPTWPKVLKGNPPVPTTPNPSCS